MSFKDQGNCYSCESPITLKIIVTIIIAYWAVSIFIFPKQVIAQIKEGYRRY